MAEEESRMRPHIDAVTKSISDLKEEIESTADKFDMYKSERQEAIKRDQGACGRCTSGKRLHCAYDHKRAGFCLMTGGLAQDGRDFPTS